MASGLLSNENQDSSVFTRLHIISRFSNEKIVFNNLKNTLIPNFDRSKQRKAVHSIVILIQ